MYVFALPLILEMPYVLKLWLKNVPEYAVLFTILALIDALIDTISYPLMAAAQATGKIKLYQAVVGGRGKSGCGFGLWRNSVESFVLVWCGF